MQNSEVENLPSMLIKMIITFISLLHNLHRMQIPYFQTEQHEHKHSHPEGDTRKIVNYCVSGQEKRKGTTSSMVKKD